MLQWTSGTNWALYQATDQVSTNNSGQSYRAVDGDRTGRGGNTGGGCAATSGSDNPWWAVDLGQRITVTSVMVVNRDDCCGKRVLHITERTFN